MNKVQRILITRYKYHHEERAMMFYEWDVMIHSRIMEEIQAIYYLMFKSDIVKDITMNGEI